MSQRGDDWFMFAFRLQYTQSICIARLDMYPLAVGTHFSPRFLGMIEQGATFFKEFGRAREMYIELKAYCSNYENGCAREHQ